MFFLDKEIDKLDVSADRITCLLSSMNEVQVALPGIPGQRSAAHLCAYGVSGGYEAVAVLVLCEVRKLAFYRYKEVFPVSRLDDVVQEGILFVESMGFMLNDLDFKNLSLEDRKRIWDSSPLSKGEGGIPRVAAQPSAAVASPSPSLGEEVTPPNLPPTGGEEKGAMRDFEKRIELSRRMGRLLASF
ncbi:MAG: hypothetical protein GXY54_05030 [Deltaproteobacteria bacterium]|nr:hypothetical protein [Deltaproteobacteria bacterium]